MLELAILVRDDVVKQTLDLYLSAPPRQEHAFFGQSGQEFTPCLVALVQPVAELNPLFARLSAVSHPQRIVLIGELEPGFTGKGDHALSWPLEQHVFQKIIGREMSLAKLKHMCIRQQLDPEKKAMVEREIARLSEAVLEAAIQHGQAPAPPKAAPPPRRRRVASPRSIHVLFVCTANLTRSFLAERIFVHHATKAGLKNVSASSAGLRASSGAGPDPEAAKMLEEMGVGPGDHASRVFSAELARQADLIMVMENWQRREIIEAEPRLAKKVRLLKSVLPNQASAEIADPTGRSRFHYRTTVSEIALAVRALVARLSAFRAGAGS